MEPTPDSDLADLFFHAAKRVRRNQEAHLAPLGLTPAKARALRVVTRSAEPIRMVDLANRLEIVPRSVTTIVDALEAAGLVVRTTDPTNRRSTLIGPTDAGRTVRTRLTDARRQAAEELFAPLTPPQRETLRALLAEITAAAQCAE